MTAYLLLFVGLLLVFLEFFLPGAILGIGGALLIVGSILYYISQGATGLEALFFLGTAAVGLATVIKLALWAVRNTATKNTIFLNTDQEGYKAPYYEKELQGKKGTCHTALRPGGFVWIDGKKYDAISVVGFMEKGDPIVVVEVEGETLMVKRG